MNSMQPSRVADFGALAQSAGFRIEDLANINTSMYSVLNQIEIAYYMCSFVGLGSPIMNN